MYFVNFPSILYNGALSTNLLVRAQMNPEVKKLLSGYNEQEVIPGMRPDQMSNSIYGDPYLSWSIFYANDTVDPLHEWYKDDATFENFIKEKYGSVDNAIAKYVFYRVNWYGDETQKSVAQYESMGASERRFWAPVTDYNNSITHYKRKELNIYTETNCLCKVGYSNLTGDDELERGDIVLRYNGEQLVARGEVTSFDDTHIVLRHVYESTANAFSTGTFTVRNSDLTYTGTSQEEVARSIPLNEVTYWEPVTYYDYEQEQNEAHRLLRVINRAYTNQLERELGNVFKR